jgi:hypothetical protein
VNVAASRIAEWRARPSQMVRELFHVEPDAWQAEVLDCFPETQRIAMVACKGPGKTSTLSWLCWNFLLCYPAPLKILATSITADNLADGLWAEMAKWQARAPLLQQVFEWTATEIRSRETQTKFMSARAWPRSGNPQEQADTLAGFHEDRVMAVLDESGGIPLPVLATAEAVLANVAPGKVAHIVQAGNPTQMDGCLYESAVKHREHWRVFEVTADPDSPLRTPRVSVEWARQQIAMHGRDNPWVLVNVFGKFPPGGFSNLLSPSEVIDAQKRHLRLEDYDWAPKIIGVDVARYGDDATVIFGRQGPVALPPMVMRNASGRDVAGRLAQIWTEWAPDAVFIDDTGGYGAAVIEALEAIGYSPVGVSFAGASDDARYANKRTEMMFRTVEWLRGGGCLPPVPELVRELSEPSYAFKGDRMALEEKAAIKRRLGYSPDHADALALTFAYSVAPKAPRPESSLMAFATARAPAGGAQLREQPESPNSLGEPGKSVTDYDPYARDWR